MFEIQEARFNFSQMGLWNQVFAADDGLSGTLMHRHHNIVFGIVDLDMTRVFRVVQLGRVLMSDLVAHGILYIEIQTLQIISLNQIRKSSRIRNLIPPGWYLGALSKLIRPTSPLGQLG